MPRLARLCRHLATTARAARRAFPDRTLEAIKTAIAVGETRHRAQLRLIIEPALPWHHACAGLSARERALRLFARYGVWDTEENCGVLVYINLADRRVEIVSDRAVGRAVAKTDWDAACMAMTQGFAAGRFHDSTLDGITRLNALLQQHFPLRDGDHGANELADAPVVL